MTEFWQSGARHFLSETDRSGSVADLAGRLAAGEEPLSFTSGLDTGIAAALKRDAVELLLCLIDAAASDHVLSDDEALELRHLQRVLRIEEGDLLQHAPHDVAHVLATEMQRLLQDEQIDPAEALHKVKLQEVLGLGYDEFLRLSEPEVDRVVTRLAERIPQEGSSELVQAGIARFRRQILALDSVFHTLAEPGVSTGGYLYLLANPAMPGVVKVGRTSRTPTERMAELSSATGVPLPFELVFYIAVPDSHAAERAAHAWLSASGYRVASNREFFAAPIPEVIRWMTAFEGDSRRGAF